MPYASNDYDLIRVNSPDSIDIEFVAPFLDHPDFPGDDEAYVKVAATLYYDREYERDPDDGGTTVIRIPARVDVTAITCAVSGKPIRPTYNTSEFLTNIGDLVGGDWSEAEFYSLLSQPTL